MGESIVHYLMESAIMQPLLNFDTLAHQYSLSEFDCNPAKPSLAFERKTAHKQSLQYIEAPIIEDL